MPTDLLGLPVSFSSNGGAVFRDIPCLTVCWHVNMLPDLVFTERVLTSLVGRTVKYPVFSPSCEVETQVNL